MAPPKKTILLGLFFVFVVYRVITGAREEESIDEASLYETKEGFVLCFWSFDVLI